MRKFIQSALKLLTGLWLVIRGHNRVLSRSRLRICQVCPERKNFRCNECGCLLISKTRLVDEECPLRKW